MPSRCFLCESPTDRMERFCPRCVGSLGTSPTMMQVSGPERTMPGGLALFGAAHRLPGPAPEPPALPPQSASGWPDFGADYEVVRQLGEGGMGLVLECLDRRLGRRVAVKCLHPSLTADPRRVASFLGEARALAAVRHPCILPVHHLGEHRGLAFFVSELVEGTDLGRAIASGMLTLHATARILDEAAAGLEALHRAGVVHCDIKPANLLIRSSDGQTLVADAGIARRLGGVAGTLEHVGAGSPGYAPPEQLAGVDRPEPAWDSFALAATAYHALSGTPAFPWVTADHVSGVRRPPALLAPRRPDLAPFDAVLQRALATDPRQRFGSMADLRAAFRAALRARPRPPSVALPPYALVADDDPDMRNLVRVCVEQTAPDLELRFAADGGIALRLLDEQAPAIAVLDVDMPAANGIEVLASMRGAEATRKTPVIVMSGRAGEAEQHIIHGLGVFGFLNKPLDPRRLMRLLAAALLAEPRA